MRATAFKVEATQSQTKMTSDPHKNKQCLLGDDPFLDKLFPLLKDKSALKKISRAQRFADRPALEDILRGTEDRTQRDAAHPQGLPPAWIHPGANCRRHGTALLNGE